MPLDLPTLFVVSVCITGLLGLFLLRLWTRDRSVRALSWWAVAYLLGGFAVGLWVLQSVVSFDVPHDIANALLLLSCGMIWSGARIFHGRPELPLWLSLGALAWLVLVQILGVVESETARVVLCSVIIAAYTFLTALELKRERREPQAARLRATLLPLLHGTVFLLPVIAIYLFPERAEFEKVWFALFSVLTLVYVVGTAFIIVIMAHAQTAQILKTVALTDPLTGLLNRRGFFELAQKVADRQASLRKAVTVLMFDLDHFKKINDCYGHAVGDDTLRVFAETATRNMRADDIVGRLGGEEFAAIVPGTLEQATVVAERMRGAFEIAGQNVSGRPLQATVSIGAACDLTAQAPIPELLEAADAALYRAKKEGRNRIASEIVPSAGAVIAAPALTPASTLVFESANYAEAGA